MPTIAAGLGGAGDADFDAGFDGGVDAGADAVAEDGAELEAAGVDGFSLDHGNVVAAVVAVVFRAGAGAEGDVGADDRVADVALAGDVGVVVNDGVFHLGAVADVAVRADAGGAADVGVRADLAVGADEDGAFDDGAGKDARAVAEADACRIRLASGLTSPSSEVSSIRASTSSFMRSRSHG